MKALILAADGFEDTELLYPLYRMREEAIGTDVAGPQAGELEGKHGYTVEANVSFADVDVDDYEVLILPGGHSPETVRLDGSAVKIARQMMHQGKPVAAICHGVQTLISAGVMEGRKGTCRPGIRDDLISAGADYEDTEVVVDANLITSRAPRDLPMFCQSIFQVLQARHRKEAGEYRTEAQTRAEQRAQA